MASPTKKPNQNKKKKNKNKASKKQTELHSHPEPAAPELDLEALLNKEPDFTNFDSIRNRLKDSIEKMNKKLTNLHNGNFEGVISLEDSLKKQNNSSKQMSEKKKTTINDLKVKINFFKEKLEVLEKMNVLDEADENDKTIVAQISENIKDDIIKLEEFIILIEQSDSF